MPEEGLAALLCQCTYQIACEVRAVGERLGLLMFFDDEPASETRGQQVSSCPGCGQELRLHLLRAQTNPLPQ
jgi:hypothetical protein